jgi:hypothetical protein
MKIQFKLYPSPDSKEEGWTHTYTIAVEPPWWSDLQVKNLRKMAKEEKRPMTHILGELTPHIKDDKGRIYWWHNKRCRYERPPLELQEEYVGSLIKEKARLKEAI